MKKIVTILLSVILIASVMGISAPAAENPVSVNSVYFEKHLSSGYQHRDYIQTGAYRAVVNLSNSTASGEDAILMLAAYDSESRLYSISYKNVDVLSGSDDYYTDDVSVTKADLSQKLKVFVWGEGYKPLLETPVIMENAECAAKINSATLTVTDGTNTKEWTGYINDNVEDMEITFYPDTLALKGRVSTVNSNNTDFASFGKTSGHVVNANYKLNESFVDTFPTLLKTSATLTLDVENGTVINNPKNDFSGKKSYNYTIVDANGRFKTYSVKVMESAIIRQSDYNSDAAISNGLPNGNYDNKNYLGSWDRIGFTYSNYSTSGFAVARENNMLRIKQSIDNEERGLVSRVGLEGNLISVNRVVTSYDIQFISLTGNGLYIGGTGTHTANYYDGRQALLFKPVTVDGKEKVEVKYLKDLSTEYRHVTKYENSFATPIYLDMNTKYEIDVIYKQTINSISDCACYAELYINGEYKGGLGSGWKPAAMNLKEANLVIDSFSSDTYKTTYDVYLDNIDINFVGNESYYLKDAALR